MMKYNLKSDKPLLEAYPELSAYPEYAECADSKLRFVFAFLDEENKETSLVSRISKACKIAKIPNDENIINDKQIERAMCRYFILLNNPTYELWLSKSTAFNEVTHQLRVPVTLAKDPIKSMEVKMKVADLSEKLRTDIMKLERTLFKDPVIEKKIKEATSQRVIHYVEEYAQEAEDSVI